MSADLPTSTTTPVSPPNSRWTAVCWVMLLAGGLATTIVYQIAYDRRQPGEWLPGLLQLLIGVFATGFVTLCCGLVAFFRREPRRWFALPPLLGGAYTTLYLLWCAIRH